MTNAATIRNLMKRPAHRLCSIVRYLSSGWRGSVELVHAKHGITSTSVVELEPDPRALQGHVPLEVAQVVIPGEHAVADIKGAVLGEVPLEHRFGGPGELRPDVEPADRACVSPVQLSRDADRC